MIARHRGRWGVLAALLVLLGASGATGVRADPARAPGSAPATAETEPDSVDPFDTASPAVVLLFTRVDCPISNRYAPEVRRIHERFAALGVDFWLVYPDAETGEAERNRHRREFGYEMGAIPDARHALVKRTGATVTPEAAVFDRKGSMLYRGRIDDRYVAFGRVRPEPTRRDLELALLEILEGREPEVSRTRAVGCFIADLE